MAPIDQPNKAKKATRRKTANDSGRVWSSTSQNATPTVAVSIHTPSVILTAAQARRAAKEKKYAGQTDEEILADQMKSCLSPYYQHLKDPVIERINGKVIY